MPRYVTRIPREVPKGLALVHNFQPTPMQAMTIGLDGFRCFYVKANEAKDFKRCNCGFAAPVPHFNNPSRDRTIPRWLQVRSDPQPLDTLARLKARQPKLSRRTIRQQMFSIHGMSTASRRAVKQQLAARQALGA
jgi:hypothetical protein